MISVDTIFTAKCFRWSNINTLFNGTSQVYGYLQMIVYQGLEFIFLLMINKFVQRTNCRIILLNW